MDVSIVRKLVLCSMLVAIGVILGGLLKIPVTLFGGYNLKISLGVAPVILSAMLFGPLYGGICGALCDILGVLIAPLGGYNPAFTLVGALLGIVPGLFFPSGRPHAVTYPRLLLAVALSQTLGSVILNTLLLITLYGSPWAIFIPRILTQLIMIPVLSTVCFLVYGALRRSGVLSRPG